jgi:mitogen-activated protein kinase kinase 7
LFLTISLNSRLSSCHLFSILFEDIKPSNILINEQSEIKLCDFGISGNLINSNAHSRSNTGSAGYIAPERIDPADPTNPVYDIRADIWSLGITLVELATGRYPYENCHSDFEIMSSILALEAPRLDGDAFSVDFKSFVNMCLRKQVKERPKYKELLRHPFVLYYKQTEVDVKSWFSAIVSEDELTAAAAAAINASSASSSVSTTTA